MNLFRNIYNLKDFFIYSFRFFFSSYSKKYFTNQLYQKVKRVGDNLEANGPVYISDPREVVIGSNVCFKGRTKIFSRGGIVIGDGVVIESGESLSSELLNYNHYDSYQSSISKLKFQSFLKPVNTVQTSKLTGVELKEKLFFLVSTGRSGTNAFAKIINQHTKVICQHEPFYSLNRLSTQLASNKITKDEAQSELKAIYTSCSVFPSNKFFGQSDLKNSNLIEPLNFILPNAKFIWLIRDPADFVASAYGRGWFDEKEYGDFYSNQFSSDTIVDKSIFDKYRWDYAKFRISGPLVGAISESEWKLMGAFERCCWYWSYWNELIEKQLNQIPPSNWKMIRLENLENEIELVQDFLGLDKENLKVEITNKANYKIIKKLNWTNDQLNVFSKWCSPGIDKWLK